MGGGARTLTPALAVHVFRSADGTSISPSRSRIPMDALTAFPLTPSAQGVARKMQTQTPSLAHTHSFVCTPVLPVLCFVFLSLVACFAFTTLADFVSPFSRSPPWFDDGCHWVSGRDSGRSARLSAIRGIVGYLWAFARISVLWVAEQVVGVAGIVG